MEQINYGYDLKKAAGRLLWRFRQENGKSVSFTPNETDIKSLNTVLEWINRDKKEKIEKNVLFAKLYIYTLTTFIRNYKTSVFDKEATSQVNRLLDMPLSSFYEAFKKDLYMNQIDKALEQVKDSKTNEQVSIELFKEVYTKEFIQANLDHEITEALNRFSK